MQKSFCDMCGHELNTAKLNGGIMRNAESFPLYPMVGPGGPSQLVQKRIMQEVWDLCEDCQRMMWKIAEEKKAELTKNKLITGKP